MAIRRMAQDAYGALSGPIVGPSVAFCQGFRYRRSKLWTGKRTMFYVSEPLSTAPAVFKTELQRIVYQRFVELGIPFTRVETDPGITMEDCQHIDARIGVHIVKTLFLCNRQQTEFYLYVTSNNKPFVTREFCAAMGGIPRVSFASAQKLWELTGVHVGATTILSAALPSADGIHLVMDEDISGAPWFACTDGTPTCFVKFRTADLLEGFLAGKEVQLLKATL